jgi:predicted enzyme related to lactoylglutathione lyase
MSAMAFYEKVIKVKVDVAAFYEKVIKVKVDVAAYLS